jgi:hypothetical protein
MLDDLIKKGEDLVSDVTSGTGSGIVDTVLGMTDLDEKAIAMFDEKLGAGKFSEMKALLADGKISKEEITKIATEAGVPDMMIEMIVKFI